MAPFIVISKEEAFQKIKGLVQDFKTNREQYEQASYKEANVRIEFINKFFQYLGWDIYNDNVLPEQYKEVINEDSIKVGGKTKAPDYAFRVGTHKVFYVEAKKPHVNIKTDADPALQLRVYAWNTKIPLSILTDFEEFAIYDCKIKPNHGDKPEVARLFYFTLDQYEEKFDTIWNIFSREAVWKGSFDKYIQSTKGKRGTSEVDDDILREIESWRLTLAKNIALRNPSLSISELNYSVQKTIDRILFLRICEDRNIEPYEKLKRIAESPNIYKNLVTGFENADDKYNSGIFDFKTDKLTGNLIIDDKILKEIIVNIYWPNCPYDFAIIKIEILGNVYEQFLGKTIRLTETHQAKVEEKPEVRKAGGIYYTPEFVVEYIVKNTVGKLIEGKTPKEIEKIRILDPACGSGTFLVRAYSFLLDYHLNYYLKNPTKYKKEVYQVKDNRWQLTTSIRKHILINNVFGVDIDPQAVELTKLSLLLKVLENETMETVNQQLKLFNERALPNLDKNIKCGNSVVDSSYFKQNNLTTDTEALVKINPFDWNDKQRGFGEIMADGKFDIIIGNPPYVKEDINREIFEQVKQTNLKKYYQGKMDFWYLFTCEAIDLLKEGGYHSFIAQNNWVTSAGAVILRDKILSETRISSFLDFNDYKVFKDASIQTMIFVIEKRPAEKSYSVDYSKVIDSEISKEELSSYLVTGKDGNRIERFKAKISPQNLIGKSITFASSKISPILDKIRLKANFSLKNEDIGNGIDVLQDFVSVKHLEALRDVDVHKGDGIFVLTEKEVRDNRFNKTEVEKIKPYYTSTELGTYFGSPKNNYWLIYADIDVRENIESYPNIKKHLDKFKKILTSAFKPYGLHRPREQRFFEGEKVLSLRKTRAVSFTYTDFPCYVSRAFLVIKTSNINLKYLTGVLNSKLIHFWLYHKGKRQGEQLQVDKEPLLDLPIYKPNENEMAEIIKSVDLIRALNEKIISVKLETEKEVLSRQISGLKLKIDGLIYALYGLTSDEIKLIEDSIKI